MNDSTLSDTDMTNNLREVQPNDFQYSSEQLSHEIDNDMSDDDDHALQYNKWPVDDKSDDEESLSMDTSSPRKRLTLEDMNKTLYFNWIKPVVKSVCTDKVDEIEEEIGSRDKAINSLLPLIRKTARQTVANLLIDIAKMKKDVFYQTIVTTAENLIKNNKLTLPFARQSKCTRNK